MKEQESKSNWAKLRSKLIPTGKSNSKPSTSAAVKSDGNSATAPKVVEKVEKKSTPHLIIERQMRKRVVGLDCEMVGLGLTGKTSALARCSIVDFDGKVLYDEIVKPKGFVTDFRTKYSGIRKSDLRKENDVVTFEECQTAVAKILKGKILVGHAIHNDMDVLLLSHPRKDIRDTSRYKPYMKRNNNVGKYRPSSLKDLTSIYLNKTIQEGEHDSVEDARCAVMLYKLQMEEWEQSLIDLKQKLKSKALQKQQNNIVTLVTNATIPVVKDNSEGNSNGNDLMESDEEEDDSSSVVDNLELSEHLIDGNNESDFHDDDSVDSESVEINTKSESKVKKVSKRKLTSNSKHKKERNSSHNSKNKRSRRY